MEYFCLHEMKVCISTKKSHIKHDLILIFDIGDLIKAFLVILNNFLLTI